MLVVEVCEFGSGLLDYMVSLLSIVGDIKFCRNKERLINQEHEH